MAERNFDEEFDYEQQEGHSFTLGGHSFHTPPVAPPGAFLGGGSGLIAAVRFLRKVVVPEDRAQLERILEMPGHSANLIDLAPELLAVAGLVLAYEETDDPKGRAEAMDKLKDVVARAVVPDEASNVLVSAEQIDKVSDWLMEVTIGRNPSSPGSSSNGAGRTSNGSKAASSKAVRAGKT